MSARLILKALIHHTASKPEFSFIHSVAFKRHNLSKLSLVSIYRPSVNCKLTENVLKTKLDSVRGSVLQSISAPSYAKKSMGVTLVVATQSDPASIGPAKILLTNEGWEIGPTVEGFQTWRWKNVRFWLFENSLIVEDHLEVRWKDSTMESVKEIIFMTKHKAASCKPALTIHPIGVPHLGQDEKSPVGGESGWAAPPCTRIGPWLRLLHSIASKHSLIPEFEITLEATHHGPTVNVPSMFVEIGSTEEYWGREDAAMAIAELFTVGLGMDGDGEGGGDGMGVGEWDSDNVTPGTCVLVGIGGGHYAPRHGDVARKDGVWCGHLISNHALPMNPEEGYLESNQSLVKSSQSSIDVDMIHGRWKHVIRKAFETTKRAFPYGNVKLHLDAKSMKSWQRQAITKFCEYENIPIGKSIEFLNSK